MIFVLYSLIIEEEGEWKTKSSYIWSDPVLFILVFFNIEFVVIGMKSQDILPWLCCFRVVVVDIVLCYVVSLF